MTDRQVNPAETTEYLLGKLVMKIEAMDGKLDDIRGELQAEREKRDDLEERVGGLEDWRDAHIKFHKANTDNIVISKNTFWTVVTALIASGLLLELLRRLHHGW